LHDVLPALLRIQVDLGSDLSTASLAAATGRSPSQFHDQFRRATGETVKQYTQRLRLERAAFRLLTERTGVADIGFDLGFGSHEVFTRAFRRRFGSSPTEFRRRMTPLSEPRVGGATASLSPSGASVSTTSPVLLQHAHLAFVRRVGPYEEVDQAEFASLLTWTRRRGLDPIGLVGIAHDAPGITPAERLRFDVAVQVSREFSSSREVGYQRLPERWCAATSYVGPFSGLGQAYRAAYGGASQMRGFDVVGLPVEEQYLTSALLTQQEIQTTRILIPLRRTVS
jgi:AraC family transcriptional regulator